eukprot:Protomagalhaensia_wolfi_Nauph_80__4819@NODE_502_length_2421_cov_53_390008_g61_i2_p1_GENE_NODE_502_length_2421_cov_53_390008_g61_i2NODE_502_length_2421_cov_53_390008_g61_i2_p1_ORF_typecomplete_len303_score62_37FKBP_C/PF00254_28/2_5e20AspBHydro_N/PF05279_11/0_027TAF4/PF05236_14/0_037Borrelia_P83/PF05262_11/0_043Coilin_N/PF15862_5/0_18Vfa1/PF08432_10/0_92DUF3138/PF11336_8/1_9CDC27/PF09507_10/3_1U79_P34/PF03064_16/3_5_NODE_502_length_2421_cov_53_390008_g61_i25511459
MSTKNTQNFAVTIRPGAIFSFKNGVRTVKCMAAEGAGKLLAKHRTEEFHTIGIFNDHTPSTIPVDLPFRERVSFMTVDCAVHISGYVVEFPDHASDSTCDEHEEEHATKPVSPPPAEETSPKPTAVKKQVPKVDAKAKILKQKAEQQPKKAESKKADPKKAEQPAKKAEQTKPEAKKADQQKAATKKSEEVKPGLTKRLPNGVTYEILKVGSPKGLAKRGVHAVVGYEGRLRNGVLFDKGELTMRVGAGEVVPGFEAGVEGMLLGEKRQLLIPARLGYGPRRMGKIPPNSDLLFTVTLRNVQ